MPKKTKLASISRTSKKVDTISHNWLSIMMFWGLSGKFCLPMVCDRVSERQLLWGCVSTKQLPNPSNWVENEWGSKCSCELLWFKDSIVANEVGFQSSCMLGIIISIASFDCQFPSLVISPGMQVLPVPVRLVSQVNIGHPLLHRRQVLSNNLRH